MKIYLTCSSLLATLFLAGCSDTSGFPVAQPGQPPTIPGAPNDSGQCTYVLEDDITVPTTLINTPASCDYLLGRSGGFLTVSSTLIIEPGVVVQAEQDANIYVEGGAIIAVGDAQNRIVFEGVNHVAGYWGGVHFRSGRESRLEYVDLKDAGQVCSIIFCADAGLVLDDVAISVVSTTVSNSYVHGVDATRETRFTRFENNRFYNNTWAGIVVDGNNAPALDPLSDYAGGAEPNGTPYVVIVPSTQEAGEVFFWRKLNAPYLIASYFNVEGGTLVLEPGVELVFDEAGWMTVQGNGVLRAIGTAAEPVIFRGAVERPGYWDGLTIWDSPWEDNELSYVQIRHSGNTDKALYAYGAVRLRTSGRVNINNSVIADNAAFGVACDDPSYSDFVGRHELFLGVGNTFSNNAAGDVDPVCTVTP